MLEETLNRPCGGRYGNVLEVVGNTPLVELPRITPKAGVLPPEAGPGGVLSQARSEPR